MKNRFDLIPENRTNYVAVIKLNLVWADHIWKACRNFNEKTFSDDDFKTHLDHIVRLSQSVEGLDEKSIEYVVFLYDCMKEFCGQLERMKAYLETIPRGVHGLTIGNDIVAAGVCANPYALSRDERQWMNDFDREVEDLYHDDYGAMKGEGYSSERCLGIPVHYEYLDRILIHAGGNTFANMIERLNTHIEMLENSGIFDDTSALTVVARISL